MQVVYEKLDEYLTHHCWK